MTVYKNSPRFVPPEERITLLSPRNPGQRSQPVNEGEWVKCKYGLYRNDIGFVCGHDPSSDAELIVAFVPRIPHKASRPGQEKGAPGSAKRKRVIRPEPQSWSAHDVEAIWGKSQVRRTSKDEYEFRHETYKSGLVLKRFPPASLTGASAPADIGPFTRASQISFAPVLRRIAQDSIKVGQRVAVISGEQCGLVGYPIDINNGEATVVQRTGDDTPLLTPLRCLLPAYEPGDHVKHRWMHSRGIVVSVDDDLKTLSFVEEGTNEEVRSIYQRDKC